MGTNSIPNSDKRRLSNIELLRIISMMMVLLVHIDGASLGLPSDLDFKAFDIRDLWKLMVESLTIIGVNCFTLISGYFGIRFRWRSIGSYLFQCLFYSVGIYLAFCGYCYFSGYKSGFFSFKGLMESFMILTHTDLWYVPAYFMLMLLAPFINAGFELLRRRQAVIIVAVFILFNVWGGWFWGGKFNPSGYTVIQLIMMYCIGRVIKISAWGDSRSVKGHSAWFYAGLYLVASMITTVGSFYNPMKAFAYNQPSVIIASVALFLCFNRMHFQSSFINYTAKSAFAVYLIHKAPLIWGGIMKPSVVKLWNSLSLFSFTFAAIGIAIFIYLLAMAIDSFRRYLSSRIIK